MPIETFSLIFTDLILLNAMCRMAADGHQVFGLDVESELIRFPKVAMLVDVREKQRARDAQRSTQR